MILCPTASPCTQSFLLRPFHQPKWHPLPQIPGFFATAKFLGHKLRGTLPANATVIIALYGKGNFGNAHQALLIGEQICFLGIKFVKKNIGIPPTLVVRLRRGGEVFLDFLMELHRDVSPSRPPSGWFARHVRHHFELLPLRFIVQYVTDKLPPPSPVDSVIGNPLQHNRQPIALVRVTLTSSR